MSNWFKLKGDRGIWAIVFMLSLVSLLAVYSSANALAIRFNEYSTEYYFVKHLIILLLGMATMYVVHLINYRYISRFTPFLLFISLALLTYTLFQPEHHEINDAARWIRIFGISFQPSDLAKVTVIVFVAKLLANSQNYIKDLYKTFIPILLIILTICGLIAPANLSTALLIFVSCIILMYVAGIKIKYLINSLLIAIVCFGLVFMFSKRAKTWVSRGNDYFHRITDREYIPNYQTQQSNIAIASGGIFGRGAGKSVQRNFLPHPYSDFIYAIIIEEYGIFGGVFVLGLYVMLLIRVVVIVSNSKTFGGLLAMGLTFLIVFQALINMGVTVGVLPVTGLPLPLISLGGTSIIFTCMSLGIVLSVSRYALEENKSRIDNLQNAPMA